MLNIVRRVLRYIMALSGRDVYFAVDAKNLNTKRYGSDYGGYVICPDYLGRDSIVYSFGLGDDVSFDLELVKRHQCQVYGYDPSPETKIFLGGQDLPPQFKYHALALGSTESVMTFYPSPNKRINYSLVPKINSGGPPVNVPVSRLSTIMRENGHEYIDLLKMDIEGAEFEVLEEIMKAGVDFRQLVVEFHHKHKEFSDDGLMLLKTTIERLRRNGYQIIDVSPGGIEYSFIKDAKV